LKYLLDEGIKRASFISLCQWCRCNRKGRVVFSLPRFYNKQDPPTNGWSLRCLHERILYWWLMTYSRTTLWSWKYDHPRKHCSAAKMCI